MKMEFNEKRMTVEELTDCIAELTRIREEKIKEQANVIAAEVHGRFQDMLDYTRSLQEQYEIYLHFTKKSGREVEVPLTENALKNFYILVKRKE